MSNTIPDSQTTVILMAAIKTIWHMSLKICFDCELQTFQNYFFPPITCDGINVCRYRKDVSYIYSLKLADAICL